ncbi:retrotransposon protein, putative, ty1-copia subclass [Tanacetum coccineum]
MAAATSVFSAGITTTQFQKKSNTTTFRTIKCMSQPQDDIKPSSAPKVSIGMQLRIVLSVEDKLIYLEHPIPAAPVAAQACQQVAPKALAAHAAWVKGSKEIAGLMLMTMESDIQRNLENLGAYEILQELKTLFAQQAEQELLQTMREFHSCKHEEWQSVSSYNYNMHSMGKTINELHAMLKLHEQTLPKNNAYALHAIRAGSGRISSLMLSCLRFPLHPRGKILLRTQSVINAVYDTGCGTHICNTTQGLRRSRKLKPDALSLYVGNGQRAAVEAIGSYHLSLPSGLVIVLNNCHYSPSITRGIISVSHLYDDGYVNCFMDNSIQVFRNNMVYFSAIPRDGIFEIDLSDSYTNVSSMYALSNKRAKSNLDSALLWHCCLGHISKKCIEKLQHDELLILTDLRAFEKCVPCMSGKMARKPYTHQVERAKDLLRLIHTDVCGPFKIVSRQGASYFVTFTDDFSRYGYVYLLKHKHEVFETFKGFQKEVESQLTKTIKSLRSDHRGEYMSQEFLDHLKDHGIIAHRTPPYTLQHNGVSKRRNRTLLDMVRSMMSQTTVPKSFWDYALETAARILNMVPTKKVEKTPYKVWHGQAPKMSYLKVWGYEALVKRDTLT